MSAAAGERERLVTPDEAARILQCSRWTIGRYADRRPDRLTKVRLGRQLLRYKYSQIMEIADKGMEW